MPNGKNILLTGRTGVGRGARVKRRFGIQGLRPYARIMSCVIVVTFLRSK
jgi:hypothetical protein